MRAAALALITCFGFISLASAQPAVYRCGSQFSDAPCPGAVTLALAPTPSATQVQEARSLAQREQALADRLRRDRLHAEREASQRSALAGIGVGARTRLPDAPPKAATPSRSHGKKKGKLGYFADDPKVTQVIEQRAPKQARR